MKETDLFVMKKWPLYSKFMLLLQLILLSVYCYFCQKMDAFSLTPDMLSVMVLDFIGQVVLILMFLSGMRSRTIDRVKAMFMSVLSATSMYLYLDGMCWLIDGRAEYRISNLALNTVLYCVSVLMSWMFWYFLCAWNGVTTDRLRFATTAVSVVAVIDLIMILSNFYHGLYFDVSASGEYSRGVLYWATLVCPTFIFLVCIIFILQLRKASAIEKVILVSYPLAPYFVAISTTRTSGVTLVACAVFCSVVFIYCNLYSRRESQLAQKQAELAETKINSMMMQINPHFIYNTLGSVAGLCTDDPEKAKTLLYTFSDYLRNNFGEMANRTMVPFEKEIGHLKTYIAIEQTRFPDVQVDIDLQVTDFQLPALSVQPLVENAITHGIMGRECGGTVHIATREDEAYYYISVEDDGVGFNPAEKPRDNRNHVGISNVSKRLKMLCDGELKIISRLGVGTAAEIRIPKRR